MSPPPSLPASPGPTGVPASRASDSTTPSVPLTASTPASTTGGSASGEGDASDSGANSEPMGGTDEAPAASPDTEWHHRQHCAQWWIESGCHC